jgi:hypothetical protein
MWNLLQLGPFVSMAPDSAPLPCHVSLRELEDASKTVVNGVTAVYESVMSGAPLVSELARARESVRNGLQLHAGIAVVAYLQGPGRVYLDALLESAKTLAMRVVSLQLMPADFRKSQGQLRPGAAGDFIRFPSDDVLARLEGHLAEFRKVDDDLQVKLSYGTVQEDSLWEAVDFANLRAVKVWPWYDPLGYHACSCMLESLDGTSPYRPRLVRYIAAVRPYTPVGGLEFAGDQDHSLPLLARAINQVACVAYEFAKELATNRRARSLSTAGAVRPRTSRQRTILEMLDGRNDGIYATEHRAQE